MNRRKYLAQITTIACTAGLAGCSDDAGQAVGTVDTDTSSTPTASPSPTESPTASPTPTESPTPSPTATASPTPSPTPTPTPGPGNYSAQTVRKNAETVSYDELFRNIDQYKGEAVYFEFGQIYQTIYEDDYTYIQMDVANNDDEWEGDVAATYWGDERLLEDDLIELWAVAEKLYEYETTAGDVRTIPLLTLVTYDLYDQ